MKKAIVYFYHLPGKSNLTQRTNAVKRIMETIELNKLFSEKDTVAIKTHFGEANNDTHISPMIIKEIAEQVIKLDVQCYATETSTLYAGERNNAIKHLNLAYKHGFTPDEIGIPIIMADGLYGNSEVEIKIDGIFNKKVNIAKDTVLTDGLIVVSHPTGHIVAGFGACIKNIGMGLSSRKGKLIQHSSVKPSVIPDQCVFCGKCKVWCPADAIIEEDNKMFILQNKCIGCGECLTVCRYSAIKYNWGVGSVELQKNMAEYALGAIKNKRNKSLFINVLTDMTKECDCMNIKQEPIIPDIGIIASTDPVALDQATLDLTKKYNKTDIGKISYPKLDPEIQIEHAEKIGLGIRNYILQEVK